MPFDVVRYVVRTSFETSNSMPTEFHISQAFLGFVGVWRSSEEKVKAACVVITFI